jgi:sec-independent protein translocase protein TatA
MLFVLALLLFGPKKLPEIGRTVGQAMRELKRMSSEVTTAFEEAMEEPRRLVNDWESAVTADSTASTDGEEDPYAPYRDAEEMAVGDEENWMGATDADADARDDDPTEGHQEDAADDDVTEGEGELEASPPERGD